MGETYTLFGIPFQNKVILENTLMEITIALGAPENTVIEEKTYLENEIIIMECLYAMNDYLEYMDEDLEKIVKSINLNTGHYIRAEEIKNRIIHVLAEYETSLQEDNLIIDDVIKHTQNNEILSFMWDEIIPSEDKKQIICKRYISGEKLNDEMILEVSDLIDDYIVETVNTSLNTLTNNINDRLKNYQNLDKNIQLSEEEIKKGTQNTIQITLDSIENTYKISDTKQLENLKKETFKILQDKINHKEKSGRNQHLVLLSTLLKKTNLKTTLKDDKGNIFFPFIADMLFAHYVINTLLKNNSDIFQTFKDMEDLYKKWGEKMPIADQKRVAIYHFHKKVHIDQVWRYIATIYAYKYDIPFEDIRGLIKFLKDKPINGPLKNLPTTLVQLNKFTKDI